MLSVAPWTPRRPSRHSLELECQVVRERDFRLIARRTFDVSENGMLVKPITRVLTGENVIVSFMAPFSRSWIDAEATVARVVHGRRNLDHGMALGLWFHDFDGAMRSLLRRALVDVPRVLRGRSPLRLDLH